MELLISLCHFCEIHGPSVVLNTVSLSGNQLYDVEGIRDRLVCCKASQEDDTWRGIGANDDKETYMFEDGCAVKWNRCEGCSLQANTGKYDLVTFDEACNVLYVTEGFPQRSVIFPNAFKSKDIKAICFRSLSCELYPKNSGMLYFTADSTTHVLSFLFSLQDSKARGFQRKYTIIVMTKEARHLFCNWHMLITNVTLLICLLQRKAKAVFKSELKPEACLNKRSIILDKVANEGNLNYFEEIFDHDSSDTSKNKIKARSLSEITGNNGIFYNLHMQFNSILKEINRRARSVSLRHSLFDFGSAKFIGNDHSSLRELYSLTRSDFCLIASNVVLGHRVLIIDSSTDNRAKLLASMLAKLLPNESIQIFTYSNLDSVSLKDSNTLLVCAGKISKYDVDHITKDFHLCLEIADREPSERRSSPYEEQFACTNSLRNSSIRIHRCEEMEPLRPPSYIVRLECLLKDVSISDTTLNGLVDSLKLQWLNRSKTMQSFVKQVPDLTSHKLQTILGVLKLSSDDLRLVQYWCNHLS